MATTHKELQQVVVPMGGGCPHKRQSAVDGQNVAQRARESPYPMISVAEAQRIVLKECVSLGTVVVSLDEALGRILSHDVYAKDPLPPFPASIKDG